MNDPFDWQETGMSRHVLESYNTYPIVFYGLCQSGGQGGASKQQKKKQPWVLVDATGRGTETRQPFPPPKNNTSQKVLHSMERVLIWFGQKGGTRRLWQSGKIQHSIQKRWVSIHSYDEKLWKQTWGYCSNFVRWLCLHPKHKSPTWTMPQEP